MISLLKGAVEHGVVVTGCGVGYQVSTTTELVDGDEVVLHVHQVLSESSSTLYGFTDTLERDVFLSLLGVQGVAGKTAISLLSTLGVAGLAAAVAAQDPNALAAAKGVGAKSAAKILAVLDLPDEAHAEAQDAERDPAGDLVDALVALGYGPDAAGDAARRTRQDIGDTDVELDRQVRVALAHLNRARAA